MVLDRHMIGNKNYVANQRPKNLEKVTFVDGEKRKVLVVGTLEVLKMPNLKIFC